MLKNTDKYNNDTAHFSYDDYRKRTQKSPNKDLTVFISVFIIGVLIILGFAKILSPNVDVGITVNDEAATFDEDDETMTASAVDDRLRRLKLEDEGKKEGEEEMFSPELDEKVVLPNQHRKTVGQMEAEQNTMNENNITEQKLNEVAKALNNQAKETKAQTHSTQEQKVQQPSAPKAQTPAPAVSVTVVNAKVVVGYYATEKQAEVAKSIIQDAGLGVTPIVKNMGGYYTLQVGSYSSREKAQLSANSLLKSNFPARVIVE